MQIDDMGETLKLLDNIRYFFKNIDDVDKKLQTALYNKELERDDLLHEVELSTLNAIERMKIYSRLEKTLQERRVIKDKIELINTLKPYTNKYIMKGILGETGITIQNVETLRRNHETRQYTPRILKDLKCAKRKETKEWKKLL